MANVTITRTQFIQLHDWAKAQDLSSVTASAAASMASEALGFVVSMSPIADLKKMGIEINTKRTEKVSTNCALSALAKDLTRLAMLIKAPVSEVTINLAKE